MSLVPADQELDQALSTSALSFVHSHTPRGALEKMMFRSDFLCFLIPASNNTRCRPRRVAGGGGGGGGKRESL